MPMKGAIATPPPPLATLLISTVHIRTEIFLILRSELVLGGQNIFT